MLELRGPFGEHRGWVQGGYDVSGFGGVLFLGLMVAAGIYVLEGIEQVWQNPGDYAYVHVFSSYFYVLLVGIPLSFVRVVMGFMGTLTPWPNLNFILMWLSAPMYLLAAFFLICGCWVAFWTNWLKQSSLLMFLLPGLVSGL